MENLPILTTPETQRLRSDYPSIEHLEAGNVASWLMERQEQLLVRAKDERTGMNLAKLITLAGGAVGAVCYATSPLALIGGIMAGVGYVWAVAQDANDSHQFAPLPFIRGNFIEFLSSMGDKEAREEYFASQNELVDLMFHLSPIERYEFGMLKQFIPNLTDFLAGVDAGKRFYAYRWLLDWYINLKGSLPNQESLTKHLATVTADARVNYEQVTAIQGHQTQLAKPPQPQFVELPQPQFVELPQSPVVDVQVEQPIEAKPDEQTAEPKPETPLAAPVNPANNTVISGEIGLEILQELAKTRRSTLLIGDTGSGKSVTQSYVLNKLFELHPDADVWVLAQKADSFCGLAERGRVTLFDPNDPEPALILICCVWAQYDQRRRLPESQRSALPPVRLILADWLSINQSLEDLRNDEGVKGSRYLSKLADIIYNGRELNVCLLVDLQSYNLAAVGLKADRNSRKNFNLIGLGNYSIDELGMVNESYGVLTNLIGDRYIISDESERAILTTTFKELQPISRQNRRPIIFSGSLAQLSLLPDLRLFKESKVAATPANIRQQLELLLDSSAPEPNLEPDGSAAQNPEPLNRPSEPLNHPTDEGCTDLGDGSRFSSSDGSERFTPLNLTKGQVLALVQSLNPELNQTQIIERLWQVKKGGSAAWKEAREQFKQLTGE